MKHTLIVLMALAAVALSGCPKQLPIQAVILSNDDGSSKCNVTLPQIDTWVDTANEMFSDHLLELTFNHADVVYVKSTMLNIPPNTPENWQPDPENGIFFSPDKMYDIFANSVASHYPDKIVILFRGVGGGGWSWGPPNLRYVSMPSYTNTAIHKPNPGSWNPNTTLLAHEVGHYLGLAHTFWEENCSKVNANNTDGDRWGQRGETDEDDVLDTPADPGAACAPTSSLTCAGGSVVVNGLTFTPPWTNFMSYHDCLPETMTTDQRRVVNWTLTHPQRAQIPK